MTSDADQRTTRELGLFVSSFGNLEFLIHSIIWALIGRDDVGRAVTEQLLDRPLGDLLARLSQLEDVGGRATAVQRAEARAIAHDFVQLLPDRNKLIHAFWISPNPEGGFPGRHIRRLAQSGEVEADAPFTVDAIAGLRQRINPLVMRAAALQLALTDSSEQG